MEEYFYSDKKLGQKELGEIKAITGCDFGFTGVDAGKGIEYKLTLKDDVLSLKTLRILDIYGLHR